jgi:hypothetical protein
MVRNRWNAEVVRSLRPEEVTAVLEATFQQAKEVAPLDPVSVTTSLAASTQTASAQAAGEVIHADALGTIRSHLGDVITVEGQVAKILLTAARNAANVEFVGTGNDSLLLWIPKDTYPKLLSVIGQDSASSLNGRTVRATGQVDYYGGPRSDWKHRLQMTLTDASQLSVMAQPVPTK